MVVERTNDCRFFRITNVSLGEIAFGLMVVPKELAALRRGWVDAVMARLRDMAGDRCRRTVSNLKSKPVGKQSAFK